jgi:hypothetical protein
LTKYAKTSELYLPVHDGLRWWLIGARVGVGPDSETGHELETVASSRTGHTPTLEPSQDGEGFHELAFRGIIAGPASGELAEEHGIANAFHQDEPLGEEGCRARDVEVKLRHAQGLLHLHCRARQHGQVGEAERPAAGRRPPENDDLLRRAGRDEVAGVAAHDDLDLGPLLHDLTKVSDKAVLELGVEVGFGLLDHDGRMKRAAENESSSAAACSTASRICSRPSSGSGSSPLSEAAFG